MDDVYIPPNFHLCIITSSLMIHGIRRERCGLMLPWLLFHIFIVLFFPTLLCLDIPYGYRFSYIPLLGCSIVPQLYFIVVVYTYYEELRLKDTINSAQTVTCTVSFSSARTCCIAWSTRTGSIIIAALQIVASIVIAALGATYIATKGAFYWDLQTAVVGLEYSFLCLPLSSLMIHGVRKERCRLMLPWMVLQITLIIFLPGFSLSIMGPGWYTDKPIILCTVLPNIYFLFVTYSYYEELRTRNAEGPMNSDQSSDPLV